MFEPGQVVADRFRLESPLGEGGMGEVWLAHHERLDMPCAVKFIRGDKATEDMRARFEREARAAAKLRSANVVSMLDYGVWEETPYIAMELLEGESLEERLAREGRLSPGATIEIVEDVVRALTRAQELGIVHRDLKPDNLFVVRDGNRELVKVLDFGIAKVPVNATIDLKTATGALVGTPHFMSPEQVHGERDLDFRSDLWSLAIIVFRCVTGHLPYNQKGLGALLQAIMLGDIPKPSEIDPDLPARFDAWWETATDIDPSERFQSPDAFLTALSSALRSGSERAGAITKARGGRSPELNKVIAAYGDMKGPITDGGTVQVVTGDEKTLAIEATTHAPLSRRVPEPAPSASEASETSRSGRPWAIAALVVGLGAGGLWLSGVFAGPTNEGTSTKPPDAAATSSGHETTAPAVGTTQPTSSPEPATSAVGSASASVDPASVAEPPPLPATGSPVAVPSVAVPPIAGNPSKSVKPPPTPVTPPKPKEAELSDGPGY